MNQDAADVPVFIPKQNGVTLKRKGCNISAAFSLFNYFFFVFTG
jgi:hypothetical protein